MIGLFDKLVTSCPEVINDGIGTLVKKLQKPANKVRAYSESIGLPEHQLVLPLQVLTALYEFNINNELNIEEPHYLETITTCACKTADFIVATNNYFGNIDLFPPLIQIHIDGVFIRNLINIIVSYFPNIPITMQKVMRQMLLFQLIQTIMNFGQGEKSVLGSIYKQSDIVKDFLNKDKKHGGAGDEINTTGQNFTFTNTTEEVGEEDLNTMNNSEDASDTISEPKFRKWDPVIIEVDVPEGRQVDLDYSINPPNPNEPDISTIQLYGFTIPAQWGMIDNMDNLRVVDFEKQGALTNLKGLVQSVLNREYNRNPSSRHLIDSLNVQTYIGEDGDVHIDGLPKQYLAVVTQTVRSMFDTLIGDKQVYYAIDKKTNLPITKKKYYFSPAAAKPLNMQEVRRGPLKKVLNFRNAKPFNSDPTKATREIHEEEMNSISGQDTTEEDAKLNAEQIKVKNEVSKTREEAKQLIRSLAEYDGIILTDEQVDNILTFKFRTDQAIIADRASDFVLQSLNMTSIFQTQMAYSVSKEFLDDLDEIAKASNFTSSYEIPTMLGIVSYEAAGMACITFSFAWFSFFNKLESLLDMKLTEAQKAEIKAEATKKYSIDQSYVKLDNKAVGEFKQAMQGNNVAAQQEAAKKLTSSSKGNTFFMSVDDYNKLMEDPVGNIAPQVVLSGIRDVKQVSAAIAATAKSDEKKLLWYTLGEKGLKYGGFAGFFAFGSYLVGKGVYLGWQRYMGTIGATLHMDKSVLDDFGWDAESKETMEKFSGDNSKRVEALSVHYGKIVSEAAEAAAYLTPRVRNKIDHEAEIQKMPYFVKCVIYSTAGRLFNQYIIDNTPEIPKLFTEQFKELRDELRTYQNTTIPEPIVTLAAEAAFFENLEKHIDNLPLIERLVAILDQTEKNYVEYNNVARALEEQKANFPINKPKFQTQLEESGQRQLGILRKEQKELDERYRKGVSELASKYSITEEEVDKLLRSSTNFEYVAKQFTKLTMANTFNQANQTLSEQAEKAEVVKNEFEEKAKKFITDPVLNFIRGVFFSASDKGWNNAFEKFIQAGRIHSSIELIGSLVAFCGGFLGGLGYIRKLWSNEEMGWFSKMILFLGSGYVSYISTSTIAMFIAAGVAPWLATAIGSVIAGVFALGIGGRIAVTTAVNMYKGFKAGSVLWKWATGKAGVSEETADAIAEAANIGSAALTSALSSGFSEILSPLKLPNAALNLGSQILPRPLKPLLTPVKTIAEPLSNLADRGMKLGETNVPELSKKSIESLFPWMKKKTEEEKPKEEKPKETKKTENEQKQNDSVQSVNPSKIPTKDGKSTEPISSKKLKTKTVKAKAPPKTTKQKLREQRKDLHTKQLAKLVSKEQKLKPRTKLTLRVEKPTPKKKKTTSSKKRANPVIDLFKIFSSTSPSKKPRLF